MPIVYALVARGKTVLAEFTATSGNFPTVTRVLLSKIPPDDNKMSYIYDQHIFHYVVEDSLTYLCMADQSDKRRIPFEFLADIAQRFRAQYGDRGKTAIAFSMNEDFSRVLAKQMEFFNDPSSDRYGRVNAQINDVKSVMVENIERVLERGEKIELLVDKTDRLSNQAFKFERQSKKLKNAMWWKKIKMYLMLGAVVGLIIFFIAAVACGGLNFKSCK